MLDHISHLLLGLLLGLAGIVLAVLAFLENGLTHAMTAAGLPPPIQLILAIVLALVVIVAAFRLFGGFIRVMLIVVVLAMVVHAVTRHDYTLHARPDAPITHI